jgi:glycosyltransferase involved in cell wall biosynthesis
MNRKKKLVFISNIPAPHQVRYCYALQEFFDNYFLFYERQGDRPDYWKVDLGNRCFVLPSVIKLSGYYLTFSHIKYLRRIDPDIIMLGGFPILGNWIAYLWGRRNKKKTVMFSERARNKKGMLRRRGIKSRLFELFYPNLDLLLATAEDTIPQFKNEFKWKYNIKHLPYATDIDSYFLHPFRKSKEGYSFIFANRLTQIYNPILAIEIFKRIYEMYPESRLMLCSNGELKSECENFIFDNSLGSAVSFIDSLKNWNDLGEIYKNSDILLLPALFSNGNFTIIEAQASGMGIVISNKVLGTNKIRGGFICEPNVDSFVNCILEYINNPELFFVHANINREDVYKYSSSYVAKITKDMFDNELF